MREGETLAAPEIYFEREYRKLMQPEGLRRFRLVVGESDLWLWTEGDERARAERTLVRIRRQLKEYIARQPEFATTLRPLELLPEAPEVVRRMGRAARRAGVGPMAAVAGAIAGLVGEELRVYHDEVMVENGGDVYLASRRPRRVAIFAGVASPFSFRVGLEVPPEATPIGICTSAGTVGPSLSLGQADAVVVTSPDPALADAAATAIGNLIHKEQDIAKGLARAQNIKGVTGVVILKGDKLGAWGDLKLVSL